MLVRLIAMFIYRLNLARYAMLDRLSAAFSSMRPCRHPWSGQVEVGMTDECRYGCKIMECSCGKPFVTHRRIYGCPQGL